MAIFTKLNKTQIKKLLVEFQNHPKEEFTATGIAMGSVNTYYKISYKSGENYYLKVDEVADKKRLQNEIKIFDFLTRKHKNLSYKIPLPIQTKKGDYYIPYKKKYILLFHEVPGSSLFEKKITAKQLQRIGKALAELNSLKPSSKIKPHRFCQSGIIQLFKSISSDLKKQLPKVYEFVKIKLKDIERHQNALSQSLIHADLFPDNIMWNDGNLSGIIDFEAAGLDSKLFDICVAFHALCHSGKRFSLIKARAFLEGYQSKKKLTSKEWKHFHNYLDLTAMRFLLTRLRDFELKGRTPQNTKYYKNYREFHIRFEENVKFANKIIEIFQL